MRFLLLPAALLLAAAGDAPQIDVSSPWARATAGASDMGAAYVTITDKGAPDELTGASTAVASKAEVHQTIEENGTTKMRPAGNLAVTPDKPLTMAPNGYHIMRMGLKAPLKAGDSFPLTLTFAHAQPVTVSVQVEALHHMGAGGMGDTGGMANMPGMEHMHH